MEPIRKHLAFIIGISWSIFQLNTALFGFHPVMIQRPLHLCFALSLAFLVFPLQKTIQSAIPNKLSSGLDYFCSLLPLIIGIHLWSDYSRLTTRIQFVDQVNLLDIVTGMLSIILLLEACRRTVGWTLPVLALCAITYQFLGPWLLTPLRHSGISIVDFVDQQTLSVQGIYGVPTGVATDYIFYFVLFAAFLNASGGGQLFMDLASQLTNRARGGPAKASIVASSIMGSINGSAVANVATTGIFTIPLMKKTGLSASLSGAIEAVASTGGQLMPPVMGASAFVLAELVGIPYIEVVKAALIPALAYYVSLYFMIDLYARQAGLIQKKTNFELPDEKILKKLHLLLPLIVLIYFIITSASLQRAAVASIIATVIISWIRKETRLSPGRIMEALAKGARQALSVSIPCATAGILIGIVGYTGIGLRLSSLIIAVSGGFLVPAMILVMIGTIILGMGMPTSGAYITAAVLLAPALSELGISQLGAHLFIFFFAALSMITPPVGLASYAAATISGANLTETGLLAIRLALAGFIVPFAFAINPILLMQGGILSILWSSGTLFLGVMALGTSLVGFLFSPLTLPTRILLLGSAILLIVPERLTDLAGTILLAGVLYKELLFKRSGNIPKEI